MGGVGGYIVARQQTPIYQASTRFVVLRSAQTSYDYYSYIDSQQLISTYAQLLSTESLLTQASNELGFPVLRGQATAAQIEDTQFVQLTVKHPDPQKAAAIANVLVEVLIEQNDALQSVRYNTAEQNLQNRIDDAQEQITYLENQITEISATTVADQLTKVEAQIESLQTQINDLQKQVNSIDPVFATEEQKIIIADAQAQINQLSPILALYQEIYTNLVVLGKPTDQASSSSTQLEQLQTTLNLYQQIYIGGISSLETLRLTRAQNTPNVVQVERAYPPGGPISPRPFQSASLAALVGLLIGGTIAFLIEYLDDTLKTPDDIKNYLGLPVIGLIGEIKSNGRLSSNDKLGLFVAKLPRSPIAEAFRSLRTNLEFSSIDNSLQVILISSAGQSEGKTTVAINLAYVLAQSGKKTLLLDADMRRPSIHKQFEETNRVGLSDLVRGKLDLASVVRHPVTLENLDVITSGSLPPNPAELLGSERMEKILQELRKIYDVIIVDSPPTVVSDAKILSTKADGMIFVIIPGHTRGVAAARPIEELLTINANILGVVMNRIPRNRDYYYGGYNYYSPYYHQNGYHQTEIDEGISPIRESPQLSLDEVPQDSPDLNQI